MTDSVRHTPEEPPTGGDIPIVSKEVVNAFLADAHLLEKLFTTIKTADPTLAYFIMGRAEMLAPHDPATKETAIQLTTEVLALLRSQIQASDMDAWLHEIPSDEQ